MVASVIYVAMCLALSYAAYRVELSLRRSPRAGRVAGAEAPGQTGTDTELIVAQRGFGKNDPGSPA
jgi:glutamate transport system permease protein